MSTRWKPYPSYKESGVEWLGRIPAHWGVKRLKGVGSIDSCGSYGVEAADGDIVLPVATTAQIYADGRLDVAQMPQRGFTEAEVLRFGCKSGDVLVVKSSGSATNIISGKAGLVDDATPLFVFSNFLMRVRPLPAFAVPKFVYALLRSHLTRQRVELMCSTTTYPNLKVSEYCSALLPVPPLDEQQSIAAFLDRETGKIDALVAKEERLIKLLQEKRTALISHAVTQGLNPNAPMKDSGIPWLGRIPVHWALLRLNRLSKNMTAGPFGSSLTKDMYVPQGYRVYGQEQVIPADFSIGDYFISEEKYAEMRQYAVSPGDVLVSCVGTFGKIAVVPTNIAPGIINPRLLRLKPDSKLISSAYMGLVLTSRVAFDQMEEISRGGTMGVLNMGMLSTLLLPVPELSEQVDIVCHVQRETAKPDALISKVRAAIERLQEYRTALISAAVTGQIDVRRVAG